MTEKENDRCVRTHIVVADEEGKAERTISRWWHKDISIEMIANEIEAEILEIE